MSVLEPFPLPRDNKNVRDFLKTRRSNLAKNMSEPGPDKQELDEILSIGARVPDHRKLAPWRFILFQDEGRQKIGAYLGAVFKKNNPDLPIDRVIFESERFLRAPLVIGVVSSPVECPRGTPEWEQILSSAVVCYNLCLAAQSYGFAAQWLTEWYAYDREILDHMGLNAHERISGFIYVGTTEQGSTPRTRPDLKEKTLIY